MIRDEKSFLYVGLIFSACRVEDNVPPISDNPV